MDYIEHELFNQFILFPSLAIALLFGIIFLNVKNKIGESEYLRNNDIIRKRLYVFMALYLSLGVSGVIYSWIIFNDIIEKGLGDLNINIFLGLIYLAVIIKAFITKASFNLMLKNIKEIKKIQLYLTLSIVGISIGNMPEIFALIYAFKILGV